MKNFNLSASLPEICAPRDELINAFDQQAHSQYLFVQAPAGYGKTVSTLLWLKKRQRHFAWLTLDQYDNSPSLFYRMLCLTLLEFVPQDEALKAYVNSPSFSMSPIESAMEFLLMFSWREGEFTLVLDDLHHITNTEILKSLHSVLRKLPTSVKVFFLSRATLPDEMKDIMGDGRADGRVGGWADCRVGGRADGRVGGKADGRVGGWADGKAAEAAGSKSGSKAVERADGKASDRMAFIGIGDLALTPEEILQHFISYGWQITKDEARKIHVDTGGWIILLNMMALSDSLEALSEKHKLSFEDFFEKNIWNSFDEGIQRFLMRTSIVDSFTPALCELLTDSKDCAGTLDSLVRSNLNLSRIGDEYRYHHLLKDFLRKKLGDSGIEQTQLYRLAAEYYLELHKYHQAAYYAQKSDDPPMSMRAIQSFFQSKTPTLDQYYELAQVFDITGLTDLQCAERPILYMPNILSAFLCGDIKNAERFFDLFYAALPTFVKLEHPIADVAVTRLILDFRKRLLDLPSFIDSLGLHKDRKVPGQAAIVTMQMPLLHRSNRDYTEFLEEGAREAVRDLLSCLLPEGVDCFYLSVQSCLLMEQNHIVEAFEAANDAYDCIDKSTPAELVFGASIGLAQICLLRSEKEQSRVILEQMHRWIEENEASYLLKNLLAYEMRQKLWDGDRNAAADWLGQYFVSTDSFGEFYRIYQSFTTVRALIALSRHEEALAAVKRLKRMGEGMKRPLDVAEADVLAAIAEWASDKRAEAQKRLRRLLVFIQPYNYVRLIANEGKAVLPILSAVFKDMETEPLEAGCEAREPGEGLKGLDGEPEGLEGEPEGLEAAPKGPGVEPEGRDNESDANDVLYYADKPLYRFAKEVYMAAYEQSKNFKGLTCNAQIKLIRLSPRQAYVLELLSKGYKNAEIVEITGLSLNTIRTHTKAVYQKLEVGNVFDAVAKAKQLGILK